MVKNTSSVGGVTPQGAAAGSHFSVTLKGVSVSRADRPVLHDVDLTLSDQTRAAVVGPNGVGKSTLLRVIAGMLTPESGTVTASPPTTSVGFLHQELEVGGADTVSDLIADRLGVSAAEAELAAASAAIGSAAKRDSVATGQPEEPDPHRALHPADRYDRALNRYLALGAADFQARLEQVADELGLQKRHLRADPTVLSGGEAERVGLAMIMLSKFDLTLLDEPTNNLDLDGLDLLERWVDQAKGGLLLVSHDRTFLERTVRSVIEIDHHHHTVSEFGGGWQSFIEERERAAAIKRQQYEGYIDERDRLAARAQTQQEWAAQGASRAKKSPADGDKHRRNFQIAQTEALAGKAKASKRAMDRLEVIEKPWEPWELRFTIGEAKRSADVVVAADRLVVTRQDFTLGPLDLEVRFGDRLAIVGKNGSGKTTLLETMLGRIEPTSGTVRLGPGVVVGELGQRRDDFISMGAGGRIDGDDGAQTLLRVFQNSSGLDVSEARSTLAKFGLDSEAVSRPADSLSPGERTRASLALFQAAGVNLLILDEPTNHLDLPAIEQLESALASYVGTLILVTHDRRLFERVTLSRTVELLIPEPQE